MGSFRAIFPISLALLFGIAPISAGFAQSHQKVPSDRTAHRSKHKVHPHSHYYRNVNGKRVHSPVRVRSAPAGATAECWDGTYSFSLNHNGTCSHHGGVREWL